MAGDGSWQVSPRKSRKLVLACIVAILLFYMDVTRPVTLAVVKCMFHGMSHIASN